MATFIQVPPDAGGKKVAVRQYTDGADLLDRQLVELGYQSPQVAYVSQASIAAGGQVTLESPQVLAGTVGKLILLLVASTVPFKAELRIVNEGVPSMNKAVYVTGAERAWTFVPPGRDFFKVPGTASVGLDGWRVVATNLDISEAADLYATFLYDQEDS